MRRIVTVVVALGLLLPAGRVALSQEGAATSRERRDAMLFEDHGDIGAVGRRGSATHDADRGTYSLEGGGENLWLRTDAFHFLWKRASGDVSLAADVRFLEPGGNPHRKACLMVRQSLEPDSPYADVALHGDGLTSLQYRETPGGLTHEVRSSVRGPARLRLEKRGTYISISLAKGGEPLRPAGGSVRLTLKDPFYVGLAVCAHDNARLEKAVFSRVELSGEPYRLAERPKVLSALEVVTLASGDRQVIYPTEGRIEAPNWSPDGRWLFFNRDGRLYRLPAAGGEPQVLDTGRVTSCNNDHGLSPDGRQMAISSQVEGRGSIIYVVPVTGGAPREVTPLGPSYWHGWSPDGKTLAYCAERKGEYDIYTIPAEGGSETRLTTAPGLDDGPDYSPDGRFIYFNSERTGSMQIWRMRPDGSGQEAVTADERNNWFPHPSPDGKWLVYLSYEKGVKGHPADKDVELRLMPLAGGPPQVLARLFGGQGTLNVPSWSPDSRQVAFVSYQLLNP